MIIKYKSLLKKADYDIDKLMLTKKGGF